MDLQILNSELINDGLLHEIIYFEELDSTNRYAKKHHINSDTLLITSHQTSGLGRFNRPWETSPGKNLTFTLVKSFKIEIEDICLVNFYASLILCETLKDITDEYRNFNVILKWPNDIILNGRKAAGILTDVKDLENEMKRFIIGIGFNVNQKEFSSTISDKATSLYIETEKQTSLEILLIKFIKKFYDKLFYLSLRHDLFNEWLSNSGVLGKKIRFKKVNDEVEQKVTVVNIDNDGALMVQYENGTKSRFYSGEISLIYN